MRTVNGMLVAVVALALTGGCANMRQDGGGPEQGSEPGSGAIVQPEWVTPSAPYEGDPNPNYSRWLLSITVPGSGPSGPAMAERNQPGGYATALEKPPGASQTWRNPATGAWGTITIVDEFFDKGVPCKHFVEKMMLAGGEELSHGTGCVQPDGVWQVINIAAGPLPKSAR